MKKILFLLTSVLAITAYSKDFFQETDRYNMPVASGYLMRFVDPNNQPGVYWDNTTLTTNVPGLAAPVSLYRNILSFTYGTNSDEVILDHLFPVYSSYETFWYTNSTTGTMYNYEMQIESTTTWQEINLIRI